MKKVLFIVLGVLVIGLLCLWYFWSVKPSFKSRVSNDYEQLLVVDIHNLRNTLISEYFNGQSLDSLEGENPFNEMGIEIPSYFTTFTLGNNLFSHQFIENGAVLNDFLVSSKFEETEKIFAGFNLYTKNRLTVVLNESKDEVVFVFPINPSFKSTKEGLFEEFMPSVISLFEEKSLLSLDSEEVKTIENSEEHISLIARGEQLKENSTNYLSFKKGKVSFSGAFHLLNMMFPKKTEKLIAENQLGAFYFQANGTIEELISNKDHRAQLERFINIPFDTINKRYESLININHIGFSNQMDTVIKFDYDENFEMVEQKVIAEVVVPKFIVSYKKKTDQLHNHFTYPTDSLNKVVQHNKSTDNFLELSLDIQSLTSSTDNLYGFETHQLDFLSYINLEAKQKRIINVKGEIGFTDTTTFSLFTLYNEYNKVFKKDN